MPEAVQVVSDPVLWDVVVEHLDEAEYACSQWRAALDSPAYTLHDLARGPEELLFAHVDGLVLSGSAVVEHVLKPELEQPSEPRQARVLAAALALLAHGRQDVVGQALWSDIPEVAAGAQHAFVLGAPPSFEAWLLQKLEQDLAQRERRVLLGIAAGRGLAVGNVLLSLQTADDEEVRAAACIARTADARRHLPALEFLTSHPTAKVRDAALVSALVHGSSFAFQRCLELASDGETCHGLPMLLVALLGAQHHHELLLHQLSRTSHRSAALFALGYTGSTSVATSLLQHVASEDETTARLAGEAFSVITGLDTSVDPYLKVTGEPGENEEGLPPLQDDDLDASLVPIVEQGLPLPNPEALDAFWRVRAPTVDGRQRLLLGEPWMMGSALAALSGAQLRRRHAVALWLLIRSAGAAWIDTRTWSARQGLQLEAAGRLSHHALVRVFG